MIQLLHQIKVAFFVINKQLEIVDISEEVNRIFEKKAHPALIRKCLSTESCNRIESCFSNGDPASILTLTICDQEVPVRIVQLPSEENLLFVQIIESADIIEFRNDLAKKTNAIETLSKSRKIRSGELQDAILELLQICSTTTDTRRISVWTINNRDKSIDCLGIYDNENGMIHVERSLSAIEIPSYFKLFEKENIILTQDTFSDEKTKELRDSYLIPNDIRSMMDVPIRNAGVIIGVLCFEQIGFKRSWSMQDQKFGLIAAQLVSLAFESNEKRTLQLQLQHALDEKENLLRETFHRVKNNLAVVHSLINLQMNKLENSEQYQQFQDLSFRVQSIATLHDLLHHSQQFDSVDAARYLSAVVDSLLASTPNQIQVHKNLESIVLPAGNSIYYGMIVSELVTNVMKHAYPINHPNPSLWISFERKNDRYLLTVKDNGVGTFPPAQSNTLGMDILDGLVEQIDGEMHMHSENGLVVTILS